MKPEPKTTPAYGAVCIDWRGRRFYSSFSTDLQELIDAATVGGCSGIIEIEESYSGKPPVWKREE